MRNPFRHPGTLADDELFEGSSHLEFEESLSDQESEEEQMEVREHVRLGLLFLILFTVFAVFGGRVWQLQVLEGKSYRTLAEGNTIRSRYQLSPRGVIRDRAGNVLATSEPSFEMLLVPSEFPKEGAEQKRIAVLVSALLGMSQGEIEKKFSEALADADESATIFEYIRHEQALAVMGELYRLPGIEVAERPQRQYVDGSAFAHVLGYAAKISREEYLAKRSEGYLFRDVIGKAGLELEYEKFLRGVPKEQRAEVNAKGEVVRVIPGHPGEPGAELHLTIDGDLQRFAYRALANRARKGAIVMLDVRSGSVLALASTPSFDNNAFTRGLSADEVQRYFSDSLRPLFNRAIAGQYPPGSTIKPAIAVAGLSEDVINEKTIIQDRGRIVVPNPYDPNRPSIFHGWARGGLGSMNVFSAIAMSSDPYFYTVGGGDPNVNFQGIGVTKLGTWLRKFGLGSASDIDLAGEEEGLIPDPAWKEGHFKGDPVSSLWYLGDTYNMSIGQGFVLVTPLQMANLTAAIANDGTLWKPYLAEKILQRDGTVLFEQQPHVRATHIADPRHLATVRQGMRRVVTNGTAQALNDLPVPVAGKTGTSQFDDANPTRTHAWFTAFAPYDSPQIAMAVLVEAGGEGSSAAAPIAHEILRWWVDHRFANQ